MTASMTATGNTVDQWIDESRFVCDKYARNLRTPGFVIVPKAAQWENKSGTKNDKWDVMRDGVEDEWVECADDAGVHGQTATGNKWAANKGDGPWSSSSSKKIDWDNAVTRTSRSTPVTT